MGLEVLMTDLIELSKNKKQLMLTLLDLTRHQHQIILADDDDITGIGAVVEEKQKIIVKIDEIDQVFLSKYSEIKNKLGINNYDTIVDEPIAGFKELKLRIQEIINLMEDIKILDDTNTNNARINLEKVKEKLKVINVGKKATNSYSTKYHENQSIFIDKKK